MKILIDSHVFDGKYQGTRTYIKGLYNRLVERNPNWDFYFISNNKRNLVNEFSNFDNVYFIEYKFKNRLFQLIFELPLLNNRLKIDYSHYQYIAPFIKIGKHIITNHDVLFEESRFKKFFPKSYRYLKGPLFRFSAKKADILLTVSEYSKEKINEVYGIPKEKIGITRNAVDFDIEKLNGNVRPGIDNILKTKYLLFVSRIEPRKNHISVLKAFINLKLREDSYKIIFVGNYDIKSEELDSYIKANSSVFNKTLVIYEKVNDLELFELYNNADLVLYPSIAEGFGIPPLEGAILEKKVLCSNLTAMSEFNFFPYHINPLNQEELEDSIIEILKDRKYPFQVIKKTILERYTWDKAAYEYERMLNLNMNNNEDRNTRN